MSKLMSISYFVSGLFLNCDKYSKPRLFVKQLFDIDIKKKAPQSLGGCYPFKGSGLLAFYNLADVLVTPTNLIGHLIAGVYGCLNL